MLIILIIGLILQIVVLQIGLFEPGIKFLAVYMLFEKIPILIGSGVIPRKFKEIRLAIKTTMWTFFHKIIFKII